MFVFTQLLPVRTCPLLHQLQTYLDPHHQKRNPKRERNVKIKNKIKVKNPSTHVRQGFTSPQYCVYTEFMSTKTAISDRNTFTLTTFSSDDPAASSTLERFLIAWCC